MALLKSFKEQVRFHFEEFLGSSLKEEGKPLKYFYWEKHYAIRVSKLSYDVVFLKQHDFFNDLQDFAKSYLPSLVEDEANLKGMKIILKEQGLDISKSGELFKEVNEKFDRKAYEYLKEFVLWRLFESCLLYTSPSPRDRG